MQRGYFEYCWAFGVTSSCMAMKTGSHEGDALAGNSEWHLCSGVQIGGRTGIGRNELSGSQQDSKSLARPLDLEVIRDAANKEHQPAQDWHCQSPHTDGDI